MPVHIQLKLFDSFVLPILLYCCEVWGFEKLEDIEQVHLTFLKLILCVKRTNIISNYIQFVLICIKMIFFISRWIVSMKHLLDLAGLSYIWLRQFDSNKTRKWLSQKIKQCYCDMHVQEWNNLLETSPKPVIYRLFKTERIYEPYLNILSLKI